MKNIFKRLLLATFIASTLYITVSAFDEVGAGTELNALNGQATIKNLLKEENAVASAGVDGYWPFRKLEQYREGIIQSILMVLVSEIGDKTFLIATILAMRHPRLLIFAASCSALWLMSLLSAILGNLAINFLSPKYVSLVACIMFIVFGFKMAFEAQEMESDEISKEMDNIRAELSETMSKEGILTDVEGNSKNEAGAGPGPGPGPDADAVASIKEDLSLANLEAGTLMSTARNSSEDYSVKIDDLDYATQIEAHNSTQPSGSPLTSIRNLIGFFLSPIFVQVFVMMFVAEWGDRSQLATIALAASNEIWSVTIGTIVGHTFCTGLAVLGGKYLAQKISTKLLTMIGALMFVIFSIMYLYEFLYYDQRNFIPPIINPRL